MWGQNCSKPALHSGQVPSESTMQPTAARSPGLNLVTAGPTLATRPTISWPGTQGYAVGIRPLHSLRTWCRSEWHTPQNRISICTSCSVGSRRAIVVEASDDVALAAENAFALYMVFLAREDQTPSVLPTRCATSGAGRRKTKMQGTREQGARGSGDRSLGTVATQTCCGHFLIVGAG